MPPVFVPPVFVLPVFVPLVFGPFAFEVRDESPPLPPPAEPEEPSPTDAVFMAMITVLLACSTGASLPSDVDDDTGVGVAVGGYARKGICVATPVIVPVASIAPPA